MGEFLALLTALLWAIGVILLKRSVGLVAPLAVSFFKSCVGFLLLAVSVVVFGQAHTLSIPARDLVTIVMSGFIGIGISDTLFLMMLARLGASRSAVVDCLYSPFVIFFSVIMLGERLPAMAAVGGSLIIGSVFLSSQGSFGGSITRKQFWAGCALGIASMATVAFAIVLVKPLLNTYPLGWLSAVRMAGGIAALALIIPFHPDRSSVREILRPQPAWKPMFWATFFGSFLSLVCWLAGFKYSQASIVALLNQMSTIIIVVLAAVFLKEPMTRLKFLAVAMAFVGAAIVLS